VTQTKKNVTAKEWKTLKETMARFGPAETFRRMRTGSLTCRKDPDDPAEWQFLEVRHKEIGEEEHKKVTSGSKSSKMEQPNWDTLRLAHDGADGEAIEDVPDEVMKMLGMTKGKPGLMALADKEKEEKGVEEESPAKKAKASKGALAEALRAAEGLSTETLQHQWHPREDQGHDQPALCGPERADQCQG
jgi:hypothetical protein